MSREAFLRSVSLSVRLRGFVALGKGESRKAAVLLDVLDGLSIRMTSLEKSLANGLLADLLQPADWWPPPPLKGKRKPPTVAEWEDVVREAETEGPEALMDALRRTPPHPSLQRRRQELRAAAWKQLGSDAAAAAFLARA